MSTSSSLVQQLDDWASYLATMRHGGLRGSRQLCSFQHFAHRTFSPRMDLMATTDGHPGAVLTPVPRSGAWVRLDDEMQEAGVRLHTPSALLNPQRGQVEAIR